MVCVCSLRTQQCAVFVSAMFVCVVCLLVISAASALAPLGWVLFSVDRHSMESLILAQDERWRRA
jgi:hypothetical protein